MYLPKFLALLAVLGGGLACQGHEARAGESVAAQARAGEKAQAPAGKQARTTPEVIAKAKSLLEQHPDAPIGTAMTVEIDGKAYIARFEEHENRTGDPNRPPGKHKGVTIYEK